MFPASLVEEKSDFGGRQVLSCLCSLGKDLGSLGNEVSLPNLEQISIRLVQIILAFKTLNLKKKVTILSVSAVIWIFVWLHWQRGNCTI